MHLTLYLGGKALIQLWVHLFVYILHILTSMTQARVRSEVAGAAQTDRRLTSNYRESDCGALMSYADWSLCNTA